MVKDVLVYIATTKAPMRQLHECPGCILLENIGHDVQYLLPVDKIYWAWCPYSSNIDSMRGTMNNLFLNIKGIRYLGQLHRKGRVDIPLQRNPMVLYLFPRMF